MKAREVAARVAELREHGLTAAEALEAVTEEEELEALQERTRKEKKLMAKPHLGMGVGQRKDLSKFGPTEVVTIRKGEPVYRDDIATAEAAEGIGTASEPDTEVYWLKPDESPVRQEWDRQRDQEQKDREQREAEVQAEARRRLDEQADQERHEAEVAAAMERIRQGTARVPGR